MNVLCAVSLKHLKGGLNELTIVSCTVLVSDKTENLRINKRAKDRQFDAESA